MATPVSPEHGAGTVTACGEPSQASHTRPSLASRLGHQWLGRLGVVRRSGAGAVEGMDFTLLSS